MSKVIYEEVVQREELLPKIRDIVTLLNSGALTIVGMSLLDTRTEEEKKEEQKRVHNLNNKLFLELIYLASEMFTMKHQSFFEEAEWRIVALEFSELDLPKLCEGYRASGSRIIPYMKRGLEWESGKIINEIVLGPRNDSSVQIVEACLEQNGFEGVKVRRSHSSLR